MRQAKARTRKWLIIAATAMLAAVTIAVTPHVAANDLPNRFDELSDSQAGAVATHRFGFELENTTDPLGSIQFEFCSNSPLVLEPCTAPTGFDISGATLASQTGNTGFTIHAASNANNLILTRAASVPSAGPSTYEFTNVINPTDIGTHYVRIRTFSSTDASGTALEAAGIAFAINAGLSVTAEVPPYLFFCVGVTIVNVDCSSATEHYIDLGEFSKTSAKTATSQFIAATNASFGYTVTLDGGTMASGVNTIPAMTAAATSTPGTSQFGLNLRANALPPVGADVSGPGSGGVVQAGYNTPNFYKYVPGDNVVSSAGTTDYQKFTVSYLVNINSSQAVGLYATTITYICLANF